MSSFEQQYLAVVRHVLERGQLVESSQERTGTGTLSVFSPPGSPFRIDLSNGQLPLLSTKFVSFKTIVRELLWMLRGQTQVEPLQREGVHIWDANATREFFDRQPHESFRTRQEGDLGPVYGHQWRRWGAPYGDGKGGIDQISKLIDGLKRNPHGRRHLLSAWNVADLPLMALPPCHVLCQFYVRRDPQRERLQLSCHLYQRSADLALGVPYNMVQYALLTHIVAYLCGYEAEQLVHTLGDAHIYLSHLDGVRAQLAREINPGNKSQPRLAAFSPSNMIANVDDLKTEHFTVLNYAPNREPLPEMKICA